MSDLVVGRCPLSPRDLQSYRLEQRNRAPRGRSGVHRHRRRGQSLDFREHTAYAPGDDFRHIDWRATARRGRPRQLQDLLVRRYDADEQLTLLISLDNRRTMAPEPRPALKWQAACWLLEAAATMALGGRDRVYLHRLFGPAVRKPVAGSVGDVRRFIADSSRELAAVDAPPELRSLQGLLPPSAVWLIVTDLYFDDPQGRLAAAIRRTLRGPRGVLVVELDSWPHERASIAGGARRVEGPGRDVPVEVVADPDLLAAVGERIESHRRQWLKKAARPGFEHSRWEWEETEKITDPAFAAFFTERFRGDEHLGNLFRRGR